MKISLKREIPALPPDARNDRHRRPDAYFLLLSLSALGVVYSDIGTSPIYALRECFHGSHTFPPTAVRTDPLRSKPWAWRKVTTTTGEFATIKVRTFPKYEGVFS